MVQEIRWKGERTVDTGRFIMFYSRSMDNKAFGVGSLVNKKYKHEVNGFEPVNERLCVLKWEVQQYNMCSCNS
jgi:hypothetical protein